MNKVFWGYQTHFSLGQSIIDPAAGCGLIKEAGYTHVALADLMSLSGMITTAKACKKEGLGLIVGVTLRVRHPDLPDIFWYPKVYAQTEAAVQRLFAMLSTAERDRDWDIVGYQDFIDALADDMTVTAGSALGLSSHLFDDAQRARVAADIGAACSAKGIVMELAAVATPMYARANVTAINFATANDLEVVVNPVALYATKEDHDARDALQAIIARRRIDMGTMRFFPCNQRYIKPYEAVLDDVKASLDIAGTIDGKQPALAHPKHSVDRYKYEWVKKEPSLPKLAADEFEELKAQCKDRFKDRVMRPVFGYQPDKTLLPKYVERLKYELDVLGKMGFAGYFLLVADLVQWSKDNGIIVGPGRGSVGGSLVAFVMGITEVDPIRFDLLFERFINPGRKDLPDADLDFMSGRRHEVVDYLKTTYGINNVAGISNYNTINGAGALREVGKLFLIPEREYECSKLVPKEHGQPVTLEEAATRVAEIEAFKDKHPDVFDIAARLHGALRTLGQHAAGIVVSDKPLVEASVVQRRGRDLCINWDKRVSEEQGLVKIDILGLSNLDVIDRAFRKIEADYGKKIDILEVPLDDEKVLKAFAKGDTAGVFQFESSGMRKLLKDLAKGGDLTFEELSAAMALFRPGPLDSGMLTDYVDIRQGVATPYYDHENMEPALSVTGGVIVYQEQVMQVARDLAGFTLQEADDLRKAMGKKDKVMMAEQRDKWVEGCVNHSDISEGVAGALFDKIEAFAGYGFNRSHSIEYSIISFVSMWLKVYYPLQFYAASLEVLPEDKLAGLIADAGKRGIRVLPPDINQSDDTFKRDRGSDNLLAPFNKLKGLSDLTTQAILTARKDGPFKSKQDLLDRVERRRCNSRQVDILDRVGALASITPGQEPAGHPSRTRDQIELMPGLVSTKVNITRVVKWDDVVGDLTKNALQPAKRADAQAVMPRSAKRIRMMVITDAATKQELRAGQAMAGQSADYVKEAIDRVGGSWTNGFYYTTMVKTTKAGKRLTGEELSKWAPILRAEIEAVRPATIIALGSEIARHLVPEFSGSIVDGAGRVYYNKDLDANIVIGITPGMIWIDPSKIDILEKVFRAAYDLAE